MRRSFRRSRVVLTATVAGVIAMFATAPHSGAISAPAPAFVTLNGEGAWTVHEEKVSLQNELETAASPINMNYVEHGSLLGRQDLAQGNTDFAISALPFTADQLKNVKGGAAAFIAAPIQVAAFGVFVEPPHGGFQVVTHPCNPDDPTTWPNYPNDPPVGFDPSIDCTITKPFTGTVRIPNHNLAAMFLHYAAGSVPPLLAWNHPDVLAAFGGAPEIATFSKNTAGPGIAGRADGDEINFYLQTFMKTIAPDVWAGNAATNPQIPWNPIMSASRQSRASRATVPSNKSTN